MATNPLATSMGSRFGNVFCESISLTISAMSDSSRRDTLDMSSHLN